MVVAVVMTAGVARAQDEPLPPVPPPPGSQPAPQQPYPQHEPVPPPPGSEPVHATPTWNAQHGPVQEQRPQQARQQPTPRRDPDRRGGWEMPELYITGFAIGTLASVNVMAALGTEEVYLYALLPPLGGTAGIVTVYLLDHGSPFRTGMPSAISMWSVIGLGEGLLLWGALSPDLSATGVLSLMTLGSAAGVGIGALLVHVLRPEPADSRLSLSGALWGGAIGLFSAMAFELPVRELHWSVALGGYAGGAILGTLLGAVTEESELSLGLFNGAIFMGGLVGLGIAGLVQEIGERKGVDHGPETIAAGLAIGMGSGVLLGFLLVGTEQADRAREREEAAEQDRRAPPPVQIGAAPLPGGAMVSAAIPL